MEIWNYNKDVGIPVSKELGNTNTHYSIAHFIVKAFVDPKNVSKNTKFLEPAVGSGSFYFAMLDFLLEHGFQKKHIIENMLYAYDIDDNALDIFKKKLSEKYGYHSSKHNIFSANFLLTKNNIKFDYIITNPPYISSKNIKLNDMSKEEFISQVKSINNIDFDNRSDIYMMFFLKTLPLLNTNGKQIFLCSDSWIDCDYGEELIKKSLHLNIPLKIF
jgi:type I restriction-modification system DNA methylase subunit